MLLMMILVMTSAFVDFYSFSAPGRYMAPVVAALVMLPPVILTIWACSQPACTAKLQWFVVSACLGVGIGIVIDSQIAAENYATPALLAVTFFAYFVSGLLLNEAVICGMTLTALYISSQLIQGEPTWLPALFLLLAANLMGIVGAYGVECMNRAAFLRAGAANDLAGVDPLTGVPNRRLFSQHIDQVMKQARRDEQPLALMILDLDYFKRYNDQFGHLAGDKALRKVASALLRAQERPLDMLARYGGEEFVAVWYPCEPEAMGEMAQRMLERVSGLKLLHPDSDAHEYVTASIGCIAVRPDADHGVEALMRMADHALYAAKDAGRNRIYAVDPNKPEHFFQL